MVISITPAGASATAFVLGDDSVAQIVTSAWPNGAGGAILEGFVSKQRREVQKTRLFRGAYTLDIARFNLENSFSFSVQRAFSRLENCIMFIASHPDTVPASGEVTLDSRSPTGRVLRYLPGAVVESVQCLRQIGLSCDFQYNISGNGAWQSTP